MLQSELIERLQAAATEQMSESAKEGQRTAIAHALISPPVPSRFNRYTLRRMVMSLATVVGVVGPASLAAASMDAVPGDGLYPVKQVAESIQSVYDDEARARHRLGETTVLIEVGRIADAEAQLQAAEHELETISDDDLTGQFDELTKTLRDIRSPVPEADDDDLQRHSEDTQDSTVVPADDKEIDEPSDEVEEDPLKTGSESLSENHISDPSTEDAVSGSDEGVGVSDSDDEHDSDGDDDDDED